MAAGVNFAHRFSAKGELGIATDFAFSSFNKSMIHWVDYFTYEDPAQDVTRWNIRADWKGAADNGLVYNIGAYGGIFNFSKALPEIMGIDELWFLEDKDTPQRQTTFGASVGARLPINASSDFGMDIDTDWQRLAVVWTPHKYFSATGINGLNGMLSPKPSASPLSRHIIHSATKRSTFMPGCVSTL